SISKNSIPVTAGTTRINQNGLPVRLRRIKGTTAGAANPKGGTKTGEKIPGKKNSILTNAGGERRKDTTMTGENGAEAKEGTRTAAGKNMAIKELLEKEINSEEEEEKKDTKEEETRQEAGRNSETRENPAR